MIEVDIEELKRKFAKLPDKRLTFGTDQLCELGDSGIYVPIAARLPDQDVQRFMDYMNFFAECRNSWPAIIAKLEAAQRLREQVEIFNNNTGHQRLTAALAAFDK